MNCMNRKTQQGQQNKDTIDSYFVIWYNKQACLPWGKPQFSVLTYLPVGPTKKLRGNLPQTAKHKRFATHMHKPSEEL